MVNNIVVDPIEDLQETVTEDFSSLEQGDTGEQELETAYEMPSKFQGKSIEEVVNSYSELEKELGRKGQEIGELRKLSDEFLKTQIQVNQQNNPTSTDEAPDFYEDPQAAIRREIDNHPKIKEAEAINTKSRNDAAVQAIASKHPEAQQTVASPEFQEWISQSKIRQRLFQDANAYDFEAADELLSTWKERAMISKTQEVKTAQGQSKARALTAGKAESRSSGDSVGGKKIYRRADLIRLKNSDPSRYESLGDEIYRAYAEGRVK